MLWYTHYLPFLGNFHPGIYPSMVLLLYVTGCWDLERVTQSSGSVLFFFHSTVLSLDRFMSCPRNRKQGMLLMQCCRTHVILFPCIFIFIVKKYYMQLYIRGRIGVSGCWKLQHSQEFAFIMTVVFQHPTCNRPSISGTHLAGWELHTQTVFTIC